jgi:hypothetical protein
MKALVQDVEMTPSRPAAPLQIHPRTEARPRPTVSPLSFSPSHGRRSRGEDVPGLRHASSFAHHRHPPGFRRHATGSHRRDAAAGAPAQGRRVANRARRRRLGPPRGVQPVPGCHPGNKRACTLTIYASVGVCELYKVFFASFISWR